MAKGRYKLANGYRAPTQYDNSFRSCICTMLILIALAVIISFFLLPWKYQPRSFGRDKVESKPTRDAVVRNLPHSTNFIPKTTMSTQTETSETTVAAPSTTFITTVETPNTTAFKTTKIPGITESTQSETSETTVASPNTTVFMTTKISGATESTQTETSDTTVASPNTTVFMTTKVPRITESIESETSETTVTSPNTTVFMTTKIPGATESTQSETSETTVASPNTTVFMTTKIPGVTESTESETSETTVASPNKTVFMTTKIPGITESTESETSETAVASPNTIVFMTTKIPGATESTQSETSDTTVSSPNTTVFMTTKIPGITELTESETSETTVASPNITVFMTTKIPGVTESTQSETSETTVASPNTTVFMTTKISGATESTQSETSTTTVFMTPKIPGATESTQTETSDTTVASPNTTVFMTTKVPRITESTQSETSETTVASPNTTVFMTTKISGATESTQTETSDTTVASPNTTMFMTTKIPSVTESTESETSETTVASPNTTVFMTTKIPVITESTESETTVASPNTTVFMTTKIPGATESTQSETSETTVASPNTTVFMTTKIPSVTESTLSETSETTVASPNTTVFMTTKISGATESTQTETSDTTVASPNTTMFMTTKIPSVTESTESETSETTVASPNTTVFMTTKIPVITESTESETTVASPNTTVFMTTKIPGVTESTQSGTSETTVTSPNTTVFMTTKIPGVTESGTTVASLRTISPEKEIICNSVECKVTESRMLSLIDHSADACDDFYTYACGGLQASKRLLEEDPSSDIMSRVTKQLKSVPEHSSAYQRFKEFYESCTSYDYTRMEERIKQAKEIFNKVGNIITDGNIEITTENVTDLLVKLFSNGSAPLFDIKLDVNATDATRLAIVLTKPRLYSSFFQTATDNLKHCRHSTEGSFNEDLNVVYKAYVTCKNENPVYLDNTEKALEAFGENDVKNLKLGVEMKILKLLTFLPSEMEIRKAVINKELKEYTVKQLQEKYTYINWHKLFTELFERNVTEDARVQLYFEDFFDKMFEFFKYEQPKDIHNALLAVYAHNLYTDLVLTNSPCEREHYCFEVAENLMPEVVSNIYLTSFTDDERKQMFEKAENTFKRLLNAMEMFVNDSKSSWLEDHIEILTSVGQKIKNMTLIMPHHFSDLDRKMNNITLNSTQYLLNAVTLRTMRIKQYFSMYGLNPRNPDVLWLLFAKSFSPDVIYVHNINTLAVPLARLVPLKNDIPEYIKMAKTGLAIGQGIGSAFTTTGLTFNITGQRINSIISSCDSINNTVNQCDKLYSDNHTIKEEDKMYYFKLEASLTTHSRQFDIIGINIVLETIGDGFKTKLPWRSFRPKEDFFLLLAQEYCSKKKVQETFVALYEDDILPPRYRLQNMLANSEVFVRTFKCHTSSWNYEEKCPPFPMYIPDSNSGNKQISDNMYA